MIDENRLIEELEFQIKNCKDFGHSDIYIDVDIAKKSVKNIKRLLLGRQNKNHTKEKQND